MADCSYSRCIQQRRNIRRELQRWTKNMVYIVGLERIAEELMGRRKWKLYQDSMQRNYLQPLNNNIKPNDKYHHQKDQTVKGDDLQKNNTLDQLAVAAAAAAAAAAATAAAKANEDRCTTDGEEGGVLTGDETRRPDGGATTPTAAPTLLKQERLEDAEDEDRAKDWSPQSKCYFCVDGKLDEHNNHGALSPRHTDSDSSDSPSDVEAPPTLTPAASLLNNHRNMAALESVTSMAALAAVAALSGGTPPGPAATPFLPLYPPNWFQLPNLARNFHAAERAADADKSATVGEQPLDLSSKGGGSGGCTPTLNNNNSSDGKLGPVRLPTLDSKHIFKAKPRMSAIAGRRTYTEDELQAALRDIQSGKLGTRRAAVIYGIPRSTLRNKIDEDDAMDDDKDLSGAEEEKEVEKALERPLLSMADILRNMENTEAWKALLTKSKDGVLQDGGGGFAPALEQRSYLQNLLMTSLLATQKHEGGGGDSNFGEVVKHMMAEEHLKTPNNGDAEKLISRPSPSNSVIIKSEKSRSESDMETEDSTSNVILKIPSFKPSNKNGDSYRSPGVDSGSLVSPPITSDSPPILPGKGMTLKDVIAKSISQKFQQSPEPLRHPIMDQMDFKRSNFTPPLGGISVIKTQPEISRAFQPQPQQQQGAQQKQQQQNSTGGNATGGKGTRPKRGKYRNYDRDSLVEAVRAVQRGEMSVHRAGSYYGVPHSTLEYKVKERHLMRPRKRDPKPNPVDEKIASLKQNDLRNAEKLKAQGIKPPQKFPPTSPNGMKLPMYDPNLSIGYTPPPFPFWPHPSFHPIPLDYARSSTSTFPANPEQFFASQMMQKLHEDSSRVHPNATPATNNPVSTPALAKSARQMAESLLDGAGSNGFLDGIIRSSLESGVPTNDEKKENKSVAPENMSNKALLDQLCRNSRLTPLKEDHHDGDRKESENSMDHDGSTAGASDIHTIELSNDSNDSSRPEDKSASAPRIYLKQELTKPENLKPEMLVRYRDVLHDADRNGITEGSASESDAAQD